jgi:hypothetical protein
MITIQSPTHVILPRKTKADKKIMLNLNVYRNLHFQVNNQAKQVYNELMKEQLKGLVLKGRIDLHFYLLRKGGRIVDNSNYCSIVDKFFCDSLVAWGCIKDDSDKYIGVKSFYPTMYDSGKDCCNVVIIQH